MKQFNRLLRRTALVIGVVTAIGGLVGAVPASSAVSADGAGRALGSIQYASHPDAVSGSYVVVLKDGVATESAKAIQDTSDALVKEYGLSKRFTYTAALKGLAVQKATEQQARRLAGDPRVSYVAQDLKVSLNVFVQPGPPSWGLDRVDQRSLPLDAKYHYPSTAPTVRAYVIDTGIWYPHVEFAVGGAGSRAVFGTDTVGGVAPPGLDCNGHGTHVAGTIGGTRVGLAKQVKLVAVRVLDCAGSGTFAGVIAGVDWVTLDNILNPRPSVANMSLGGGFFAPLNDAVTNSINANVHYSIAAGNSNLDACTFSPASTPRATTLAASDIGDNKAAFSNFGPCVDLYGPGVNIFSSVLNNAYANFSGTSMASPHAAGTAALWRQRFPADTADQVAAALVANATPNVIIGNPANTPNLLVFMGMIPM